MHASCIVITIKKAYPPQDAFNPLPHLCYAQVCRYPVQEAEVRVWAAQGQPEDRVQGELQVRGAGEVTC